MNFEVVAKIFEILLALMNSLDGVFSATSKAYVRMAANVFSKIA